PLHADRRRDADPGEPCVRKRRGRHRAASLLSGRHRAEHLHVDAVQRHPRADPATVVTARLLAALLVLSPVAALAHSFPDHSEPRVGHTGDPPRSVRIWFDGDIEPVFSTIRVEDANKRKVDSGDPHVDPADHTLLEVNVPTLPPGAYKVF